MSYSRWSNSCWYTFWSSNGSVDLEYKWPTKNNKRNQAFEICDSPCYYLLYAEIEDKSIDDIIKDIQTFYTESKSDEFETVKVWTPEEWEELKGYILEFKKDIDEHFKFWNFMEYEWYYPLRNKITRKFKKKK